MRRHRFLLSVAILLAGASAAEAAKPAAKPTENKQPEKQEFGAHDRPWAKDYLKQECEAPFPGLEERAPGLIESKAKVEFRLQEPDAVAPAPLSAALADTTAALEAIRTERERLEEEWRRLNDERAIVAVASRRAKEELDALAQLRGEVSDLIDELEIREDANIERITELVKNLNAKDAARLLASREPKFILEVLDVLDARLAAEVLGRLDDGSAEDVMALIAERGRPGDQELASNL
ncbi:hypothetical protein [Hyphococcus sp.]|jgi:flagellar motility protein MotE (MotC chaperone)|uniref:hypothetical protein n=1 Tax=Hyphococcus sp. TaxID=2038636 RepID=UPI003D126CB5